jgi:hypothetical protein
MDMGSGCDPTLDSLADSCQLFLSSMPPDELMRCTLERLARITRASYARNIVALDDDEQALVG